MTEFELFDKAELLDRVGNDEELVGELIELYLDDYPEKIQGIEDGLASADSETVRKSAHGLKGASGNLSFNSVSELARQIEFAAKDNDLESAGSAFTELKSELEKLLDLIS